MKKSLFMVCAAILFVVSGIYAQGGYTRVGIGYGFASGVNSSLGPTTLTSLGSQITHIGEPNETSSNIYGSLGKGLQTNIAAGYMFNPYFGLELGFMYNYGQKTIIEEFTNDTGGYDRSDSRTIQYQLRPAFTFVGGTGNIAPYARVGAIIPVGGGTYGSRESNDPSIVSPLIPLLIPEGESFVAESVARGKFTVGVDAAIGIKYRLSDRLSLNGELFYNALRVKRKSYEVTKAALVDGNRNEIDVLPALSAGGAYAYTEYKDEIDAEEFAEYQTQAQQAFLNNPPDLSGVDPRLLGFYTTLYGTKDYPAWELRNDGLFNTLGLQIGITYSFGGGGDE